MSRNCHYWRRAGAKSAPSEIVVLDCETWHDYAALVPGGEFQTLRVGCALAYRLERGRRTRQDRLTFREPAAFWAFVRRRLNPRRPVWVVGHNLAFDLGVVSGWGVIGGPEYETEKAAVSGQLFYIKGRWHGCGLNFCDTANYYRCSLSKIGEAIGIPKMPFPAQTDPDAVWERYCRNDVEVTAGGIDALIRFVREGCYGPWQPSIAGLSFSAFRSRFMSHKVLVHNYRNVLRLERAAYYGGVVDTPVVGARIPGPVYELDVCSMYPSLCRLELPHRFKGHSERTGVRGLRSLAEQYQCTADVTLNSPDTPYPIRQKRGTYYPVGRFRTTLSHPELVQALDRGHVQFVHRAAWYHSAPIFKDYMEHFTTRKGEYRRAGNEAFSTLCKYYGNSLYGKSGQLSPQWQTWGPEAMGALEETYSLRPGTLKEWGAWRPTLYRPEEVLLIPEIPEAVHLRDYYGVVEVKTGCTESRDSCPVIAATVTSSARVLLRTLQGIAGSGHWFYSDTDSIWVDATGKTNLEAAGRVRDDVLGYLSVKGEHGWLLIHGPKDYETPTVRRLKGIRATATPDSRGGWNQLHFPSGLQQVKDYHPGGVFVRRVRKELRRELTKSVVTPGGITRPLVFPFENPERESPRWLSGRDGRRGK